MRVSLILLAFGLAVAAGVPQSQRIVGGSVTTIDRYPATVALLYSSTGFGTFVQSCGAAILNNRSFLTAAHCIAYDSPINWQARVGSSFASSGGVVHTSNLFILHPSYNVFTADSDIAIIRTNNAISYNNNVQPGSIASSNYNLGDNQVVWAVGWGRTSFNGQSSNQLRHVQIWTVNQNVCAQRYSELPGRTITANMLCSGWLDVGGRDQCTGDSGGPLYHNNVVVGVSSWGQECAHPRYPGVNARVSRFTSWIQTNA